MELVVIEHRYKAVPKSCNSRLKVVAANPGLPPGDTAGYICCINAVQKTSADGWMSLLTLSLGDLSHADASPALGRAVVGYRPFPGIGAGRGSTAVGMRLAGNLGLSRIDTMSD